MYVCTVKLHSTYISQLSNVLKHSKVYLIGQNGSNQSKSVLKIYKIKCHELNEMAKKSTFFSKCAEQQQDSYSEKWN